MPTRPSLPAILSAAALALAACGDPAVPPSPARGPAATPAEAPPEGAPAETSPAERPAPPAPSESAADRGESGVKDGVTGEDLGSDPMERMARPPVLHDPRVPDPDWALGTWHERWDAMVEARKEWLAARAARAARASSGDAAREAAAHAAYLEAAREVEVSHARFFRPAR